MGTNMDRILNPDYEICLCRHVKTKDVMRIIKSKDITSLKELCKKAGVGDKCGGCRGELEALLDHCLDEDMLLMDLLFDN